MSLGGLFLWIGFIGFAFAVCTWSLVQLWGKEA